MAGNRIGTLFTVTTWGESHGPALGALIDGCPPGIPLSLEDIQKDLDRRRPGSSGHATSRRESDEAEILSGIFEGRTTGTPIAILVRNIDAKSGDYDSLKKLFRPGHGDYTYFHKYGIRDHRGGGRSSGRETVARVAAGAVAKKVIGREGIEIVAYTRELGGVEARTIDLSAIEKNDFFCPDVIAAVAMEEKIQQARAAGDTLGGIVEIIVRGCPPGLGEPVFDRMDADLAKALMSVGTVKGVEIGAGFASARMTGSQCNDPIGPGGFVSNHAGGVLAGITTGAHIVARVACKPIPSIEAEQYTVDIHGRPTVVSVGGRHDRSVIPRIIPVVEAMTAITIADHLLRQKALSLSADNRL